MNGNANLTESINSPEMLSENVFFEWCKKFDVEVDDVPSDLDNSDKTARYDFVFRLGAQKFLSGFLSQNEKSLDLPSLKSELDELRMQGDKQALGKCEQDIALTFQHVISTYAYEETTNYPVDILDRKEMNCVGASLIGGMLLEGVGIKSVLAGGGSHTFLIMVTADNRVLWQDMQDGKEIPDLNNQELSVEKIIPINDKSPTVVRDDIVSFILKPSDSGISFAVNIKNWNKDNIITLQPFFTSIESQELINTGFQLTNSGKHAKSIEVLEIAKQKSPEVADVYLGLAKALRGLGRFEEAVKNCKKALEIDPTYSYVQQEMDEMVKQLQK